MRKRSKEVLGVDPQSTVELSGNPIAVWAGPSAFNWRHVVFMPQLDDHEVRAVRSVEGEAWLEWWDPYGPEDKVWVNEPSRSPTRRDLQLLVHVRGLADRHVVGLARAFVREKIGYAERHAVEAAQQLEAHQERVLRLQLREAALGLTDSHALATAVRIADSFPSTPARLLEAAAEIVNPVVLSVETPPPPL